MPVFARYFFSLSSLLGKYEFIDSYMGIGFSVNVAEHLLIGIPSFDKRIGY
jgi:hypothetical protein